MTGIDTHAHVFPEHPNVIQAARYVPSYEASVESFIAHLDQHGLTYGILIQPSFLGVDNSLLLKAIQYAPHRLKGVAVVDKTATLDDLILLKKQGIVGIRLNLFGLPIPSFEDPEWKRLLAHVEMLEWQIELHAPPSYLIELLPVLNNYAINLVIDHFGRVESLVEIMGPDYQTFLDLLNIDQHWLKVSGFYRLGSPSENICTAKQLYQLFKEKGLMSKLVWGSDWPHTQYESKITYEKAFKVFKNIINNESEISMILNTNASKLFKFLK